MAVFDDDNVFGAQPRKPQMQHEIGQLLDTLSAGDLRERIEMLRAEIARLDVQLVDKEASRRAADAFFQR